MHGNNKNTQVRERTQGDISGGSRYIVVVCVRYSVLNDVDVFLCSSKFVFLVSRDALFLLSLD